MEQHFKKTTIWIVTLLVFFVLEGVLSLIAWQMYEGKKAFILERNSKVFEDVYQSTRRAYKNLTKLLYEEVINRPDVIAIFERAREGDPQIQAEVRRELYERLKPTYDRLQALNLKQLHFHLPDGTSFLRFHRPEKFGDDLSSVRYSVMKANRDKGYVEGFEEGRVYNGFRHVYPVFDARGNHLGSVETSLSFNALRLDIESTTGEHIDFVVRRDIVEKKVWDRERSNYGPSLVSPDYLYEKVDPSERHRRHDHDSVTLSIAKEAEALMRKGHRFALYAEGYIVTFEPITNVEGSAAAAYLIGYSKSNAVGEVLESTLTLWWLSSALIVLASVLFYMLMLKVSHVSRLATYDALTELLNRSAMTRRLEDEAARTERTHDTFAILFIDVDDFKALNDRFGHETGDRVLKHLGRIFQMNIRRNDAVGRWGGEEFLVCLPHTPSEDAEAAAEKLRMAVVTYDFGTDGPVSCSFGLTVYHEGEAIDVAVSRADEALYRAKAEGKNRVVTVL